MERYSGRGTWASGRPPGSRDSRRSPFGPGRLLRSLAEPAHLVAYAHHEPRLLGILEDVDDPALLVLEVDGLAVGHQVQVGFRGQDVAQPPAHLALQEPQHAPDLLQREALAS